MRRTSVESAVLLLPKEVKTWEKANVNEILVTDHL